MTRVNRVQPKRPLGVPVSHPAAMPPRRVGTSQEFRHVQPRSQALNRLQGLV